MICKGCGNKDAIRQRLVTRDGKLIEMCDLPTCGDVKVDREKKTGFAFKGKDGTVRLLKNNRNLSLAKNVRQTYRGDMSDEVRGRDT